MAAPAANFLFVGIGVLLMMFVVHSYYSNSTNSAVGQADQHMLEQGRNASSKLEAMHAEMRAVRLQIARDNFEKRKLMKEKAGKSSKPAPVSTPGPTTMSPAVLNVVENLKLPKGVKVCLSRSMFLSVQ
jgi:C4-dicarboxylate-specific signal transduction histidine kinase